MIPTTTSIWDLYLDVHDAAPILEALAVLERNRAVREPLPLEDAHRLLARLRTIANISAEESVYWAGEADIRRDEAEVDGVRWGSPEVAARMRDVAEELASGSRRIAAAAMAAAEDLAPRLPEEPSPEVRAAAEATRQQVTELLARQDRGEL